MAAVFTAPSPAASAAGLFQDLALKPLEAIDSPGVGSGRIMTQGMDDPRPPRWKTGDIKTYP